VYGPLTDYAARPIHEPLHRFTLLLLTAALLGACAPAAAASTSCRGDGSRPSCRVWTGKAVSVNDGDTIDVDIDGDGDGRKRGYQVRFAGVQAMELTRHHPVHARRRGECHGLEATARVEQLIRSSRRRVRLTAQRASSRAGSRLARFVAIRKGGRWQDVGELLMAEGHTLFLGSDVEPAWNHRYDLLGQQAALRGIGLWNPDHCGAGPSADVPLRIWAQWDPPGIDSEDINGEWTKVRNLSAASSISLAGWWVRDSMLRRYRFPAGTMLAPGATLTLHTGSGRNTRDTFYWGLSVTLFPNVGPMHLGDGAYLFDPRGDLRASMTYPCLVACSDPDQGAVAVEADPRRESVLVRNVAARAVDLSDDLLAQHGSAFPFKAGTELAPGEELRIDLRADFGLSRPIMRDAGGSISVTTFRGIVLACDAWGGGRC